MGWLFYLERILMQVSVIIPTMVGREQLLKKLLSTIPKQYEVIVVDDMDILLAAKRNKGAKKAKGEYFFFVDDDNYLELGAIQIALEVVSKPGIGIVGFMACYDDKKDSVADGGSNRNYLTGFTSGINTNASWSNLPKSPYEVDEIANAFIMHSELFFELNGFDEKNFPMDMHEADFCKRAKNIGLKVVVYPFARCYHKSITYSCFPTFRRPLYAYYHGSGRINYSRKFNHGIRYFLHLCIFLPLFICFYTISLLWRRNFKVILPFWKGILDGLTGNRKNDYQKT